MQNNFKLIYDSLKTEPVFAKDIVISNQGPWIYISEKKILCFTGVLKKKIHQDVLLEQSSYRFDGKHSFDEIVTNQIMGFFRLSQGAILLDDFIDKSYNEKELFKRLPVYIKYPSGADTHYGIIYSEEIISEEIAIEIERQIFGLTSSELDELLIGYNKAFGACPTLTRYQRNSNYCDLCDMWIPKAFPYLKFEESGYDFSHVSLWGGYRFFQLLMQNRCDSPISKLLIENGVSENIIDKLFKIRCVTNNFMKAVFVTKGLMYTVYEE